ncbi:MAG: hypothetical protein U0324_14835 [Polyangiales bacterium]
MATPNPIEYHPTPKVGVGIGLLVLALIALPGLVASPREYLSGAGVPILIVCALGAFGLVQLARYKVVIERLDASRELRFTRVRWPLGTLSQTLPLDAIASAEVERVGRRSRRVVIVMRNGDRVPLTGGGSRSPVHDDVAARTAALLAG